MKTRGAHINRDKRGGVKARLLAQVDGEGLPLICSQYMLPEEGSAPEGSAAFSGDLKLEWLGMHLKSKLRTATKKIKTEVKSNRFTQLREI